MRYVFQNIFTCLLLAAIIGGIAGWILRAMRSGSKLTELEGMWQGKLDHLEDSWRGRFGALQGERDKLVASLRDTEAVAGDWKAKFSGLEDNCGKLKLDFDSVSGKLPALETAIAAGTAAAVKLTADLKSCSDARTLLEAKAGDLEAKLNQAVADDKAGDAAY